MKIKLLILFLFTWSVGFGQAVPNTATFTIGQVMLAVYGDSAVGRVTTTVFTDSNAAYFDATYGSKTMSPQTINGFRHYRPTFLNAAIYDYYTRDNCDSGYSGTSVLIGISAGVYISYTSQIDADNQAQSAAQTTANTDGDCVADEVTYYSAAVADWFTSNDGHCDSYVYENCGTCNGVEGYTRTACLAASGTWVNIGGGAWAYFTSSYGDYTSIISQADADAQAQAAGLAAANAASCGCNSVPQ